MKVLFCASEVAPFAKTGGLADVTGSLPLALGKLGVEILVTMPRYRGIEISKKKLSDNVQIRFVENEEYFNRSSLYGNERGDYEDNLKRFHFFCRRSLEIAREIDFKPDILHAHDWQTALLPVIIKMTRGSDEFFRGTKTLLTIHNVAYQGHFPRSEYDVLGLDPSLFSLEGFEFYGKINLLKGGLIFADAVSTVSPTYAKEITTREYGFGLESILKQKPGGVHGILNGLDYDLWDPATDKAIKKKYSLEEPAGKAVCKADLQKIYGLSVDPDVPAFGIVTRLAEQKGLDILSEAIDAMLAKDIQFVLLGDGDPAYKTTFSNVGKRHAGTGKVSTNIGFDSADARKVYAGADFFLMPSYFEPCGLGQLISLKYGTLPIVRATGGLVDTIVDADADPKNGNGFMFRDHTPERLIQAVDRAIKAYGDKKRMSVLKKRAMKADFSWTKSAKAYRDLYKELKAA
jgi:starch synthase